MTLRAFLGFTPTHAARVLPVLAVPFTLEDPCTWSCGFLSIDDLRSDRWTLRRIIITRTDGRYCALLEALENYSWVEIDAWQGDTAADALDALRTECLAARGIVTEVYDRT